MQARKYIYITLGLATPFLLLYCYGYGMVSATSYCLCLSDSIITNFRTTTASCTRYYKKNGCIILSHLLFFFNGKTFVKLLFFTDVIILKAVYFLLFVLSYVYVYFLCKYGYFLCTQLMFIHAIVFVFFALYSILSTLSCIKKKKSIVLYMKNMIKISTKEFTVM